MSEQEAELFLEKAASELGEHFDAVQILVSGNVDGLSFCVKRGAGNWYARQGMAHEFINCDIAQENAQQIASQLRENGGDDWKGEA